MKLTIDYKLTSPVSHIGEVASTGSYFQTILTQGGRLPVITGNAVRGCLRDAAASHLLNKIGKKVSIEIFNVLFSGGNISGSSKDDIERAKMVREHFPIVSVFGGGLGTMIMSGKIMSGFLYPVCDEAAEMLGIEPDGTSWRNIIDEIEFTRTDDGKNDVLNNYVDKNSSGEPTKDKQASTQMRFSVQYMAAGTSLRQSMVLVNESMLEFGALLNAFAEWFRKPARLGGMSAKGFGAFDAVITDENGVSIMTLKNDELAVSADARDLIAAYNDFITADESQNWIHLLGTAKK